MKGIGLFSRLSDRGVDTALRFEITFIGSVLLGLDRPETECITDATVCMGSHFTRVLQTSGGLKRGAEIDLLHARHLKLLRNDSGVGSAFDRRVKSR